MTVRHKSTVAAGSGLNYIGRMINLGMDEMNPANEPSIVSAC
jgi:hypothetical protein